MPEEHYASLAAVERRYWWHLSRLDRAERMLRMFMNPAQMRAVDLGCGTGGFIAQMHERCNFSHASGFDISELGISRCPDNDVHYAAVQPGDYSVVANADVVFLMDVLEHVDADSAMLQEIFSALPAGAYLVMSVPAHQCLYSEWDATLGHYRRYTRDGLTRLATGVGFSVLRAEYAFMVAGFAIGLRRLGLIRGKGDSCEFPPVPGWLNATLRSLNDWEGRLGAACRPPFGGSLFAVLQKRQ